MWKLSLLVRLSFRKLPEHCHRDMIRPTAVAMASFRRVNDIFDAKQFQSAAEIVHLQNGNGSVSLTRTRIFIVSPMPWR